MGGMVGVQRQAFAAGTGRLLTILYKVLDSSLALSPILVITKILFYYLQSKDEPKSQYVARCIEFEKDIWGEMSSKYL